MPQRLQEASDWPKKIIKKASGMTTGQAGRYFGWGRGTKLTKGVSDFTKDQLIKDGYTRSALEKIAKAYEGIAKNKSANDVFNQAAAVRAKQIREILERLF